MWAIVSDITGDIYASDFASDFDALDVLDTAISDGTAPADAVIAYINE